MNPVKALYIQHFVRLIRFFDSSSLLSKTYFRKDLTG